MVRYGGSGRHIIAVTPNEMVIFLKLELAEEFIYILSITVPKLSILCLYLQIFTTRSYRYTTFAIAGLVVLTYLASLILTLTVCTPFSYNWNKNIPAGHCVDLDAVFCWISMPNIVSDVAMLILPIPVIWRLQVSFGQQIGLTITFLTGSFGIVTAIIRFVTFFTSSPDPTWHSVTTLTWTIAEPGMYFIAACLPSLRPLFLRVFQDLDCSSLRTRLRANYGIKWFSTHSNSKEIGLALDRTTPIPDAYKRAGRPPVGFERIYEDRG